jgi:hypothetical protein
MAGGGGYLYHLRIHHRMIGEIETDVGSTLVEIDLGR